MIMPLQSFVRDIRMERKGSGFGKILDAYEFQVNYKADKRPVFHSDRASFFVIMPNLNYDIKLTVRMAFKLSPKMALKESLKKELYN